jgi:hypothetical protein
MSTELESLARRAVACKGWRWMPGMADCWGGRVREGDGLDRAAALPDFRDPATLGCLLALVREAYRQPRIVAVPMSNDKWGVAIPSVLRTTDRFRSDTEAEALVKALEAAP